MNKSILVLEENSIIHGLIGTALDIDGLTLHHEFNPDNFVERAKSLMPDLILISNVDQSSDYAVCRELKSGESLGGVPLILLANSNESIDPAVLAEIHVEGVVRKPFEASDLQQQVSKHLDIVDLIGSAYEYKKSQAFDDKADPLADLQVVDAEVLGLLQGDEPMPAPAPEVPRMETQPEAEPAVPAPPPAVEEETLAEALQPEAAFEPLDEDLSAEVDFEPLDEDLEMEVEPLDEDLSAEAAPPLPEMPEADDALTFPSDEGALAVEAAEPDALTLDSDDTLELQGDIEELGPEDLLEEEAEDTAPPPAFDQTLEGEAPPMAEAQPLDRIEVEISDDDVDFSALDDDLDQEQVSLFETDLGEGGMAADDDAEDIPLAVRRMMELKPVFSLEDEEKEFPGDAADGEEIVSLVSSEGEIGSFDEEFGTLDDISLQEPATLDAPEVTAVAEESAWEPPEEAAAVVEEETTWTPPEEAAVEAEPAGTPAVEAAAVEEESLWTPSEDETTWTPPEEAAAVEEEGTGAPAEEAVSLEDETPWTPPEEAAAVEEEGTGAPAEEAVSLEEETPWTPPEEAAAVEEETAAVVEEESTWTPPEEAVSLEEETTFTPVQEDDDEEFKEEYLGDEELDEDRILAAMQEAEATEEDEFDDEMEDFESEESEMDELVARTEMVTEAATPPPQAAPVGMVDELVLDQDEEAMMMASLEEEETFESTLGDTAQEAAPAAGVGAAGFAREPAGAEPEIEAAAPDAGAMDQQLEDMGAEAMGELEGLDDSISEIEGMQPPEEPDLADIAAPEIEAAEPDWADEPAPITGESAGEADLVAAMAEDEPGLDLEENQEVSVEAAVSDAVDDGAEKEDQELPLEGLDEGGGIGGQELPLEEDGEIAGQGLSLDELDEGEELDLADDGGAEELAQQDISEYIEDDGSDELEVGGMAQEAGAEDEPQDSADEAGEDFSDFEEELMGLKEEIAANPEGERISDLLEKEGIKGAVDELDFDLPQSEHNLTRAMGVSELPGDETEGEEAAAGEAEAAELDEPTFAADMPGEEGPEPGALPTLDLSGGMIDEEMKVKLSEVLDEMITASVRKAVKEEIPKLMDQLEKENQ